MAEKKTELQHAVDEHLLYDQEVNYFYCGKNNGIKKFLSLFEHGKCVLDRNSPDGVIYGNNTVFIIEHFEFDCYENGRRGSKGKRELEGRIAKESKRIFAEKANAYNHGTICSATSYRNYVENVKRNFESHYANIKTYKENLRKEGIISDSSNVEVLFFIEDTTPLGTMVQTQSYALPVCLGQCQEFLALLSTRKDVNYVIACSKNGSNKIIWFISNEEISKYQKAATEYSEMTFTHLSPQIYEFQRKLNPQ